MQPRLISCITDLLHAHSDSTLEDACDALTATILDTDDDFDKVDLDLILAAAHYIDDSESYHAAHIRDALRDNGVEGV